LLYLLCLVGFASSIAWRTVDPMLLVIARDLGVSVDSAAYLSAAYSFPFAVMQLFFGPVGDALGKTRMIKVSLGLAVVSLVWLSMAPSFPAALAARALGGAFAGGLGPMSLALIGDRVHFERRQVALGQFLVAAIFGQMLGASAAGLLVDWIGWRAVFDLTAVVVGLVFLAVLSRLRDGGEARTSVSFRRPLTVYRDLLRDRLALLVLGTIFCEGLLVLGQMPFVAALTRDHGAQTSAAAGIVLAAFAAGGVTYGVIVRYLLRALGPWKLMRAGGVTAGGALLFTLLPVSWFWLAVLFFSVGLGFYSMHGTVQARATELAPGARGAALAMVSFCFYAGQGGGPALGGTLASIAGYGAVFAVVGAATICLGLGAARLMERRLTRGG